MGIAPRRRFIKPRGKFDTRDLPLLATGLSVASIAVINSGALQHALEKKAENYLAIAGFSLYPVVVIVLKHTLVQYNTRPLLILENLKTLSDNQLEPENKIGIFTQPRQGKRI